jgi:hypothetical protein
MSVCVLLILCRSGPHGKIIIVFDRALIVVEVMRIVGSLYLVRLSDTVTGCLS